MVVKTKEANSTEHLTLAPGPQDGESAWKLVQREVDARIGGAVKSSYVERQYAAEKAIAAIEALHEEPVVYGVMKGLAALKTFRFDRLERTRTLAWALWYVRHCEKLDELAPDRMVSEATVKEAVEIRARVLRIARHYLEDHVSEGVIVASINGSLERREIGNHLLALKGVCERNVGLLSKDFKWNNQDYARLGTLSQEFVRALGKSDKSDWSARGAVLLEMLQDEYKDVRDTGRWILRAQPEEGALRFPFLVAPRKSKGRGTVDEPVPNHHEGTAPSDGKLTAAERKNAGSAERTKKPGTKKVVEKRSAEETNTADDEETTNTVEQKKFATG
jgi:hypothetical protein